MKNFSNQFIEWCNHPFFAIVGAITTVILFFGILYPIICWFFSITPLATKFGKALQDRKIAIFGDDPAFGNLSDCLIDSNIFKSKNIIHIRNNNIDKANDKTIFLVDWESAGSSIDKIFASRKNNQVPIVIYAKPASIPHDKMNDIANRANTVVVNFRGRLLNDILTSLITTEYNND